MSENPKINTELADEQTSEQANEQASEQTCEQTSEQNAINEPNIEQIQSELESAKSKLIEAQADFENIKKRLEKDKITAVNFANESFARDLLGVIDALEMALNTQISEENTEAKTLKEGVSLTIESFKTALAKHGVKMIETSVGGEFNPEIHNAMSYVESESVASGFIAQIYQNGYMYNDRVLRPSMVLIAK